MSSPEIGVDLSISESFSQVLGRAAGFRGPLPGTSSVAQDYALSFTVFSESIQYGSNRCDRVFVSCQKRRRLDAQLIVYFTRAHRVARFHQDHAAGLGKPWFTFASAAVDEVLYLLAQNGLSEH